MLPKAQIQHVHMFAGLHTLAELQQIKDTVLDLELQAQEAARVSKVAARRASCTNSTPTVMGQKNEHQKRASREKALAMFSAAGSAFAASTEPAAEMMKQLIARGSFHAPTLPCRKRCERSL